MTRIWNVHIMYICKNECMCIYLQMYFPNLINVFTTKTAAHPSNVEIDTCTGGDNQLWTYNQQDSTVRLSRNTDLCIDVGSVATCQTSPWSSYRYCQDTVSSDERAIDLLNRLTLEDKVCWLLGNLKNIFVTVACANSQAFMMPI